MTGTIGQELVARGLITPRQLGLALEAQAMVGYRLGTNLVDLGFVEVEALGRTLAGLLRLRHATPRMLRGLPRSVIRALPREVALRAGAIVIQVEGRRLHVAVARPRDLAGISVQTGHRVTPWIAPEIEIHRSLERYHGVPQPRRYLPLSPATSHSLSQFFVPLPG